MVITWFSAGDSLHRDALVAFASALHPIHVYAICELGPNDPKGSTDFLSRRCGNLSILEMDAAFGRGAALRAGLAQTREESVAFVDLNAEVAPAAVHRAFRSLVALEADGVVFDRFLCTDGDRFGVQGTLTRLVNRVARAGFGIRVGDVRSPLKAFTRSSLLRIFEGLRLYAHGFDIDLLLNAKKCKCRIVEIPFEPGEFSIERKRTRDVVSTIAPLAALRFFHSPLRNLPFVDLIAARYALPAKRSYSIAIFCWRDPSSPKAGGGEVYLHEQAKCWVRQGCEVTWVSERFPGSPATEVLDGIKIVRRGRGLFVFAAVPFWHLFESDKRYDFIIDVMNGLPFFTPLYSMKPKVCLIYHVHAHHFREELPRGISDIAVWVECKLVPFVYRLTRFLTISDSTMADLTALGISKLPIAMIHSGVPSEYVPGPKSDVPTIVYVGRIRRYKQIRKLLDAFEIVKRAVPDARLVVAGAGDDLPSLREETRERGLSDVDFLGRVDEATKIRLLQEGWVFGMPSQIEGWGIVVVEAAACGTPAVAYDVNGLRDCILDGRTGYLASCDEEFAARLLSLVSDRSLRTRMSLAAAEWSKRFSWERTAALTLETIRLSQPWRAVFEPIDESGWGLRSKHRRSASILGGVSGNAAREAENEGRAVTKST